MGSRLGHNQPLSVRIPVARLGTRLKFSRMNCPVYAWRLRARGAELVGEMERYEDSYRLCCVRGPEGIIVELAEQIG
jgi:hypothetical protein